MKKYLGDILVEKGYLKSEDLQRALAYQLRKSMGSEIHQNGITDFLLDVARTKYNQRGKYCLGKILTELALLSEDQIQEALEIQRTSPVERPANKLASLALVGVRINSSYSLIDLLNQILVLAAELVEAESASLIVHDHPSDALVILMPTGPLAEHVKDLSVPKGMGIAGWVYSQGRSIISNDASRDSRFYAGIDATSGYTSRQILCVPLTVKGRRLGAIEAINKAGSAATADQGAGGRTSPRRRGFTHEDCFLLEMFSAQACIAIENTRLSNSLCRLQTDCQEQKRAVAETERRRAATLVSDAVLHRMRQAFIPIQGYAKRMKEIPQPERLSKYGAYIEGEVRGLMDDVDDSLRFLKGDVSLNRERLTLREALRDLEELTWVRRRLSGIDLSISVPDDLVMSVDRKLLVRCFEHLFRNSRDAMPDGGAFSISARKSDGEVSIRVTDRGGGVPEADRERIFEPFYSAGKPHAAGLGLPIVKAIIEAHGGTIRMETPEAGGAAFTISLPADD